MVHLFPRSVPAFSAGTGKNWGYYALPSNVTAGANGTGKVTQMICNYTGATAAPPAMTFDFTATD